MRVTQMTLVCLTVYMLNTCSATISTACSSKMNWKPSPGSLMRRAHWRGMGRMPTVTPSAPRFSAASAHAAFSALLALASLPSLALDFFLPDFAFGPTSSFRRTITYSDPFSRCGNGWRELMICGDKNGMTLAAV